MNNEKVKEIKKKFLPGTVIQLDHMEEDPRPESDGAKGRVVLVDDIGTVHCIFEDMRCMGVIPGVDRFHVVEEVQ